MKQKETVIFCGSWMHSAKRRRQGAQTREKSCFHNHNQSNTIWWNISAKTKTERRAIIKRSPFLLCFHSQSMSIAMRTNRFHWNKPEEFKMSLHSFSRFPRNLRLCCKKNSFEFNTNGILNKITIDFCICSNECEKKKQQPTMPMRKKSKRSKWNVNQATQPK